MKHYLDHFERREPFEMEYRLRRHDGEYRWIFDRGVPYTDDAGAFAGFIGSCVDVDERRRAQDSQHAHNLEQLALARDFEKWILAIVGHDIRDPLGSIQLSAHVIQLMPDASEPVKKQAQVIGRGVKRIEHIVGDLLDLSREREGSGISVDRQPTDLRSLCQQIIDELAGLARDREITFDCEADGAARGTSRASSRRSPTWPRTRCSMARPARRCACASRALSNRWRSRCTTRAASPKRSCRIFSSRSVPAAITAAAARASGWACSSPTRSRARMAAGSRWTHRAATRCSGWCCHGTRRRQDFSS